MQKPLSISPCSSHPIPSQSETESKTAQNRDATQYTPQISIPHFHLLPFHSRKAQYLHSRITPILLETHFHELFSPFSNTSPSQTIQFHTLPIHTPKLTKHSISFTFQFQYPSPFFFIPFQHPFNNHHPSASNRNTSHLTITNTLLQTHHTLPLPFANPSLTLPPKENTTHALPSQHFTTPLNSKESKAMHLYNLTIHKPSVVQRSIYGWCRLR